MSIELCVLASGSAGNCSLLRTPDGSVVLIDAGLGPRTTAQRMNGTGVRSRGRAPICLTHLDSDHFRPTWLATVVEREIDVFCHESRLERLLELVDETESEPELARQFRQRVSGFNGEAFELLPGVRVNAIPLAHDGPGSHGFVIDGFGRRIGWATDLGHVPDHLLEHFADLDVLAIESNYDPEMELSSARPAFLKRRIMGGRGHLSNDQALRAVREILDRCERASRRLPQHIVLLHRSRECNCPKLLRKLLRGGCANAPATYACRAIRAIRVDPTQFRGSGSGEQLTLAFS